MTEPCGLDVPEWFILLHKRELERQRLREAELTEEDAVYESLELPEPMEPLTRGSLPELIKEEPLSEPEFPDEGQEIRFLRSPR